MNQTAYVVSTNVGGVDTFFKDVNGVKPNFVDDVAEAMFMTEEDAIKLSTVLNDKTDMYFEVILINFE